jgi:thioredoxin-related protein
MKTQFAIVLMALINFSAISQEIVETPKQSNYYKKFTEITKVELSDKETVLYTTFKKSNKDTLLVPKTLFIEDENSGKKHFVAAVEGIVLGQKTLYPEQGKISCKLIFPPLEKSASTIDLKIEEAPVGTWQGQPRRSRDIAFKIEIRPLPKLYKEESAFSGTSYKNAFVKAKQENKNVLLFFTAHWCGPCNWMKDFILSKPEVNRIIKDNYVAVTLNRDTNIGSKLFEKYEGSGIPYFVLLTPNDEILKTQTGSSKKDSFLEFLKVEDTLTPKKIEKVAKKPTVLRKGYGLRLGAVNNSFSNNNADSRTGFAADVFMHLEHPNDKYIFRYGLGFSSKGVDGFSVNYLKLPLEFGVKIFNGSIINVPGGIRANVSPYYALRLNKNNLGLQNNDYGTRFGLSHYIGGAGAGNSLELELYYEHGFQDILKNVSGKQSNRAFGVSLLLSF